MVILLPPGDKIWECSVCDLISALCICLQICTAYRTYKYVHVGVLLPQLGIHGEGPKFGGLTFPWGKDPPSGGSMKEEEEDKYVPTLCIWCGDFFSLSSRLHEVLLSQRLWRQWRSRFSDQLRILGKNHAGQFLCPLPSTATFCVI
jgi:hypothetical protein